MPGFALLVCELNIARFRALLDTPVDEAQRRMLTTLLAEEQTKETAVRAAAARDPSPPPPVSRSLPG